MKHKKPLLYGLVIAAGIAAVVLIAVFFLPGEDEHVITLPTTTQKPDTEEDPDTADDLGLAKVDRDTVQVVIELLKREESYEREIETQIISPDATLTSAIEISAKGSSYRIKQTTGGDVKNWLIIDDDFWLWYNDDKEYFQGKLSRGSEVDALVGMLTYEEILSLPKSDILDASFVEYEGEGCIRARYSSGRMGYVSDVYISVDTGLLVAFEDFEKGSEEPIYRMRSISTTISTPEDAVFILPK